MIGLPPQAFRTTLMNSASVPVLLVATGIDRSLPLDMVAPTIGDIDHAGFGEMPDIDVIVTGSRY